MTKKALRNYYKEKRKALTTGEQSRLDDLLLIQFQQADIPFVETLFSYWPMASMREPDTHLFADFLEFRNPELRVAYPRITVDGNTMISVLTDDSTRFLQNGFGTYEPETGEILSPDTIDIIFVPLLCFDKKGYRVGYRKGYYDRYLAACNPDCIRVGFSYFEPIDEIPDKHEFDVPLSLCMTPQSIYVF